MAVTRALPRRGTSVSSLLTSRRPSAVLRCVIAIVVDAVNGESGLVAVSECPAFKTREVFSPIVADTDPSGSVPDPVFGIGITTALAHACPNVPERGPGLSVLDACCSRSFYLSAAARRRVAGAKVGIEHFDAPFSTKTAANDHPAQGASFPDGFLFQHFGDAQSSVDFTHRRGYCRVSSHSDLAFHSTNKFHELKGVQYHGRD